MIINCDKLDADAAGAVCDWLKANGCDYHTPLDGTIVLRGGWIETPVFEKIGREKWIQITYTGSGPEREGWLTPIGIKRFRHRVPLSSFEGWR